MVVAELELVAEAVEADIKLDPEQAVFPSAYPIVLTYVEVEGGSQRGNFLVVVRIAVQRLGVERMLVRLRIRELRSTRDPSGEELERSRMIAAVLDVEVRWLSRGRSLLVFSFGRVRREVGRVEGY
jgi:hypothetical protein